MDKVNIYLCDGALLLSLNHVNCNTMDGSGSQYVMWKKPTTDKYQLELIICGCQMFMFFYISNK